MNHLWVSIILFQALSSGGSYIQECIKGKKWHANNTDYEVYDGDKGLIVVAKCTLPGFYHQGQSWVSCVQGRWQHPLPQCKNLRDSCKELSTPSNGSKSCDATAPAVGSKCNFSCRSTHYVRGSRNRQCTVDLKWTGNEVRCFERPECPVPPPLHNGTVIGCSHQNIPRFGSSCIFKCNEGFLLVGPEKLQCRVNGKLTDNFGSVLYPRCHDLKSPCATANCSHYCRNQFGVAECFCHEGYRLHEDGKRCIDINECVEKTHQCQQICRNNVGSYTCACIIGYIPENRFNCKKINSRPSLSHIGRARTRANSQRLSKPCKVHNGGCEHICDDSYGLVACKCKDGYDLSNDGKTCKIRPEPCNTDNGGCQHKCKEVAGVAICICHAGFELANDGKTCRRIGTLPESYLQTCAYYNGGCLQICNDENGIVKCSCKTGYKLLRDNRTCADINECLADNFNCSDMCVNLEGSARCTCNKGFKLMKDGKHCTDIDECADEAMNECNQKCHNTNGSYRCSCDAGYVAITDFKCQGCRINSYRSSSDTFCIDCPLNSHTDSEGKASLTDCVCNDGFYGNITDSEACRDIDECSDANFGCSDTCVNTPGSAHCTCPRGFELKKDQKTCSDIDECKLKNGGCQGICDNLVGSFRCSCSKGYTISASDSFACDDIDECQENNGGCSNDCVNFPGAHHCACPVESQLGADGKTCHTLNCPGVAVPYYSSLRCFPKGDKSAKKNYIGGEVSVEFSVGTYCWLKCNKGYSFEESSKTIECQSNGLWNDTLDECRVLQCPPLKIPENGDVHPPECKIGLRAVRERCYFTCNEGYFMKGRAVFLCKNKLQWNNDSIPTCLPEKTIPFITCPNDIKVNLMPNESNATITVPFPKSNMENLQVTPEWAKLGELVTFPAGKTDIVFIARNPHFQNMSTSCTMSVSVVDIEPPTFLQCPSTIILNGSNTDGTIANWVEPEAVDNVGIKTIFKTAEPLSNFPPGIHPIEYTAEDFAGNTVKCSFEIHIISFECEDLADPENGEANCMDWVYGKLCEPSCNMNYTRGDNETQFYVCDDTGTWSPSNVISACLPECGFGEVWSENLQHCVSTGLDTSDAET